MTKKSWQKIKQLENETSFQDERKNILHLFKEAFNYTSNTIFLEGKSPTLNLFIMNSKNAVLVLKEPKIFFSRFTIDFSLEQSVNVDAASQKTGIS